LLVDAYNSCFRVHFPATPEMTCDRFRAAIRSLDIWTSSCMVAYSGDKLIGVMIAAKREADGENLIHSIGVHPEYQRNGHARHLLESLAAKLAILGPRRLRAELPLEQVAGIAFMQACGYAEESRYTDFTMPAPSRDVPPVPICFPVDLDSVEEQAGRDVEATLCWARTPTALANRRDRIAGLGVASGERIEAHVLYHDREDGVREILAFGCEEEQRRAALLRILFEQVCAASSASVVIPRVHPAEIDFDHLGDWGFSAGEITVGLAMEAQPV